MRGIISVRSTTYSAALKSGLVSQLKNPGFRPLSSTLPGLNALFIDLPAERGTKEGLSYNSNGEFII